MASQTPYAQLTGTWKFWVATASTAIPDIDAAPSGSWTEIGATDGDQTLQWLGALVAFSDNETTGPRKHVRPEEGFTVAASLVDLTLEKWARVLSMASSDVTTTTSGGESVKKMPLKRGFIPTRYALLARGGAIVSANTLSPYGAWPSQLWIPQGVFDGEPSQAYGKSNRPMVPFLFRAEVDSSQSAGEEFGYLMVQSS